MQKNRILSRPSTTSLISKPGNIQIALLLASPSLPRTRGQRKNGITPFTVNNDHLSRAGMKRLIVLVSAFQDLQQLSISLAHRLAQYGSLSTPAEPNETVAFLCPSSVDFLFGWLALMRLGYAVLLIAYVNESLSQWIC